MSVPKLIDATDPKYKAGTQRYSFSYVPADTSWKKWRRSKQEFSDVDDAIIAAGKWLQVCYDNDWPVAVRLEEVK